MTYGVRNFNLATFSIDIVADKCLFCQKRVSPYGDCKGHIVNEALSLWNDTRLFEGEAVDYHAYEVECHIAVVDKIVNLLHKKFSVDDNLYPGEILIERELRGYFNGEIDSLRCVKRSLCCLIPIFGWAVVIDDLQGSKYEGEALIRISLPKGRNQLQPSRQAS